jgi:hypothetical protein
MDHIKFEGVLPNKAQQILDGFYGYTEQETQIMRLYDQYSTTYIIMDSATVIGAIKVIAKYNHFAKLPCEYAYAVALLSQSAPINVSPIDHTLSLRVSPDSFPMVEVGYLKIADYLPITIRGELLHALMWGAAHECYAINFTTCFVSCAIKPQLERLYMRNFHFTPAAIITYNQIDNYKLFYKNNIPVIMHTAQGIHNNEKETCKETY